MIERFTVVGVREYVPYDVNGNKGEHHHIYVINSEPLPKSVNSRGNKVETLKCNTAINIHWMQPNDIIDVDFNRYGRVAVINKVETK